MTTAHLLENPFYPQSIKLGRLILNPHNPTENFLDPFDDPPADNEVIECLQKDYKETWKLSKGLKAPLGLCKAPSPSQEAEDHSITTLSAPEATIYDLANPRAWFESACARPTTRGFLERQIDNDEQVYLVVGFRTIQGSRIADITLNPTRTVGVVASIGSPAAWIAVPSSGAEIAASDIHPTMATQTYRVPADGISGEQVFTVLYRRVEFKWLSSRSLRKGSLESNNRWFSHWDWRGPKNDNTGEDDVLEASLTLGDDIGILEEKHSIEDKSSCSRAEWLSRVDTHQSIERIHRAPGISNEEESINGDLIDHLQSKIPIVLGIEEVFGDIDGTPEFVTEQGSGSETNSYQIDRLEGCPKSPPGSTGTEGALTEIRGIRASVPQNRCQHTTDKSAKPSNIQLLYRMIMFPLLCGAFFVILSRSQ